MKQVDLPPPVRIRVVWVDAAAGYWYYLEKWVPPRKWWIFSTGGYWFMAGLTDEKRLALKWAQHYDVPIATRTPAATEIFMAWDNRHRVIDDLLDSILLEWHDVLSAPPSADYHRGWNDALLRAVGCIEEKAGVERKERP